jgi:glutamate-5-semialdehyde dehydrogenase
MSIIKTLTLGAVKASKILAILEESIKNQVLIAMAVALRENKQNILVANELDLTQARQNSLSSSMIDRLTLNDERIEAMA